MIMMMASRFVSKSSTSYARRHNNNKRIMISSHQQQQQHDNYSNVYSSSRTAMMSSRVLKSKSGHDDEWQKWQRWDSDRFLYNMINRQPIAKYTHHSIHPITSSKHHLHHHHRLASTTGSRTFSSSSSSSSSAQDDNTNHDDGPTINKHQQKPISFLHNEDIDILYDDDGEEYHIISDEELRRSPKRVWKSTEPLSENNNEPHHQLHVQGGGGGGQQHQERQKNMERNMTHDIWRTSVDQGDLTSVKDVVDRISVQEKKGGRMRQRKLGVLREDPKEDMRLLIENYTVPAIASALRDREDTLQHCASLISENKIDELKEVLRPYESHYVDERRQVEINLDLRKNGFDKSNLEIVRKGLNRMPRRVSQAHRHRAGVVLPLCNIDGVPCILFEKRSKHLRAHPDEVCLPGGMVSSASDRSIVATCLREMAEEIQGIDEKKITVLGVLRCNWGEVHHLVGVAVTPVVCFIGDMSTVEIRPNPDEVAECFTVPLDLILDDEHWVHKQDFAPMFTGGPYPIWGLTGYILHRFVKDVLARYRVQTPSYLGSSSSFRHQKFRP